MTTLLNELRRNLESADQIGDNAWAKALKARIAKLEAAEPEVEEAEDTSTNLADLTLTELRKMAADAEIEGRSTMSKDELVAALSELE